jgi:hypothetical protein
LSVIIIIIKSQLTIIKIIRSLKILIIILKFIIEKKTKLKLRGNLKKLNVIIIKWYLEIFKWYYILSY